MFHLQNSVPGWTDSLRLVSPKTLVKSVNDASFLREAKQLRPDCTTLFRRWFDDKQVYDGASYNTKLNRARDIFDDFLDGTFFSQYAGYVDIIGLANEIWAQSQTYSERMDRVEQDRAFIQVFNETYAPKFVALQKPVPKLALSSAAVGNDIPRELAVLAMQTGNYLQYHPYTLWYKNGAGAYVRDAGDWQYLSGRWARMEMAWNLKPTWVMDEGGPFQSVIDGWRSDKCLGWSVPRYVEAIRAYIRDVKTTSAYREGRIIGPVALFTTGRSGETWKHYWTEQPELNALATMIGAEWSPGTSTPPPPSGLNAALIARSNELQCIRLNAAASIQNRITRDGRIPVGSEGSTTYQSITYVLQPAESLTEPGRWVYYCRHGDWSNVKVIPG